MSLLLDALRRAGASRGDTEGADPAQNAPEAPAPANPGLHAVGAAPAAPGGRARAEAVLRGGQGGPPRLRAAALAALVLTALVGVGMAGAWFYYETSRNAVDRSLAGYSPAGTPASRIDPPAAQAERSASAAPPAEASIDTAADDAQPTPAAEPAVAAETSGSIATQQADPGEGDEQGEASAGAPESGARAQASTERQAGREATDKAPRAPQRTAAPATESAPGESGEASGSGATARPAREAAAPLVRASERPSPLVTALQSGYQALRAGDITAAQRHYDRALELAPGNRDARLGAAAVARRQGDDAAAVRHYRRVLADRPRDPYARAGLSEIEAGADPRRSESELKTLLRQDPDAHALRFALGNLYAREQRWARAQAAYFEAFRGAPREADYAFNLAVALDHLGQRRPARNYYEQAVELAADGGASFSVDAARQRLEALSP